MKHYKKEDHQKRKLCFASEKMQQNQVTKLTKGESLGQPNTNWAKLNRFDVLVQATYIFSATKQRIKNKKEQ